MARLDYYQAVALVCGISLNADEKVIYFAKIVGADLIR